MPTETDARQRWPVQTRAEAFEAGAKRYFTGKACKNGHWDQRNVASGICVGCNRMYAEKFRDGKGPDGLATVPLRVHPDDVEALRAYAVALQTARDAVTQAQAFDVAAAHARVYGPNIVVSANAPKMTPR